MNYNKKTVMDIDVRGKKILLRCDFNVPMDKQTGEITDMARILAAIPTISYLLDNGAAVIACSHLGRPKGEKKPGLSLSPVAERLSLLLGKPVKFSGDIVGPESAALARSLAPGEIILLENLRFDSREEKNDAGFAQALASMADIFVSDAFGTVHRAHASTAGVADFLPAVSGLLVSRELEVMSSAINEPARPLVTVLGGAKVSDKIGVINNLLEKADAILIGGGMAYTFIKALGHDIGDSLCEPDRLDYALEMIEKARARKVELLLPCDHLAAREFSDKAEAVRINGADIPDGLMGMDIGEKTIERFSGVISSAGTVIWNGPMGVFEFPAFETGTRSVADALAACPGITIIGGGDSAAAVSKFGVGEAMTHISTGGGATMELLEGIALPGVACLMDK